MIEQKTRIDAHLVVVSHVPYVERDGACWTNAVEWRILQIFTSHFREVTLVRPRMQSALGQEGWVRLPESVRVRELRVHNDYLERVLMYAGVAPKKLPELLQDADVIYGRLPGFEAYYALRLGKKWGRVTMASLHGDWPECYRAGLSRGWRRLLDSQRPRSAVITPHRDRWRSPRSGATFPLNDSRNCVENTPIDSVRVRAARIAVRGLR